MSELKVCRTTVHQCSNYDRDGSDSFKKHNSDKTVINLLEIDKRTLRQLHIDGITLKCYDAINQCHRMRPLDTIDDVVVFFINFHGRIMNKNHIKKWRYRNIFIKINRICIDYALLRLIQNRLKYLKYNISAKGQQRYKIYDSTKKSKQKCKKYKNLQTVIERNHKSYQMHSALKCNVQDESNSTSIEAFSSTLATLAVSKSKHNNNDHAVSVERRGKKNSKMSCNRYVIFYNCMLIN